MMKEKNVYLVPTLYIGDYFKRKNPSCNQLKKMLQLQDARDEECFACLRAAAQAGVKVVCGTGKCEIFELNLYELAKRPNCNIISILFNQYQTIWVGQPKNQLESFF